ncbi:MAG: hypothetical protein ACLFN4_07940 [Candidatus Acetothermia bacterium]
MKKLIRTLYKLARGANTAETLASLNPVRIIKRLVNVKIGRNLWRIFFK